MSDTLHELLLFVLYLLHSESMSAQSHTNQVINYGLLLYLLHSENMSADLHPSHVINNGSLLYLLHSENMSAHSHTSHVIYYSLLTAVFGWLSVTQQQMYWLTVVVGAV